MTVLFSYCRVHLDEIMIWQNTEMIYSRKQDDKGIKNVMNFRIQDALIFCSSLSSIM